ncbi:MAG TPA: M12 family metallo-peptidase, partial [Solirubrobacter sp.]|nr:M12 family metallo-peptidase [Solirubrobacter sp.]
MSRRRLLAGLCSSVAIVLGVPSTAQAADAWTELTRTPSAAGAQVKPEQFRAFTLDHSSLRSTLARAPRGARSVAGSSSILSLPGPAGDTQRFRVYESSIMEPGLAAKHPEIKTYAGRGIDDPTASIVADLTPLGFHASVRSARGGWYVDPYYKDKSVYVSYFTRALARDAAREFVQRDPVGESPAGKAFSAGAVAGPEIQLRTYRLALVTDPSYANYHGADNVTAAKVTLMNRVNQIYETESAIRMVLIEDTDKLNLNTPALATGPNGPCGAAPCYTATNSCNAVLNRNRYAIGQIVGAGKYDIGHIAMGNSGGGVAGLGVVGLSSKATGCTGLATPTGDYFAVDYVAHEMGHQFAGNHTFNGTLSNCGGNRSGATSVEPGSGSSIMAYAGICSRDNLQPHSDPYWVPKSYEEIAAHVTGDENPVNEVQNVSFRDFDGTDSFTLSWDGKTSAPIVRGTNYTAAAVQAAIQGPSEVQTVALTGYDADGDSYRFAFRGATSEPIVRGQNNTANGIANALRGGNEQQQVSLTGFNQNSQSFQIQINGQTSATLGQGGMTISNANVAAAVNAIPGFAGTVTSAGAGNNGFTLTFGGASANTDVPAISIVNCTGSCVATVRETAKGGTGVSTWPTGATVAVGGLSDAGYTLTISGAAQGSDFDEISVADAVGAAGTVTETVKGAPGILPPGATATVTGLFGSGTFNDTGFQVTFGAGLGGADLPPIGIEWTGATGFVGETDRGGAPTNKGFTVTPTGNHAPDVTVPGAVTIPPRTPFALTGSATDPDGDAVTYMWEQVDRAGIQGVTTAGTSLVNQVKTNGVLFRQMGVGADISLEDSLKYHSPGQNHPNEVPTRVFPDMAQILADNTNAATGRCPDAPTTGNTVPVETRECFAEWLPTTDWVGFLSDRTMTFRLTARDGKMGGGGVGFAETKVTVAPLAGPFRVTSQSVPQVIHGTTRQVVTWDVAGTDAPPINVANVKITLSTDGGETFDTVLAESTPNDGSHAVNVPDVDAQKARIKVEAIGNVFFDISHADFTLVKAATQSVSATVPATLSLTLGPAASFGAFTPGAEADYDASTSANVVSSAGDAALSVTDPGA